MSTAFTKRRTRDSAPELALERPGVRRITRPRKGAERVTLRTVREALGKTQADIARALETDQGEVSRIERRPDVMLSTLRRYAEALGVRCEVAFVFASGRRVLIAEAEGQTPVPK
jgi:DNA-binding XRE family transcriptional regulator